MATGALEVEKPPSYKSICSTVATDNRKVRNHEGSVQDSMPPHRHHSTHNDTNSAVFVGRKPKNVIIFGETGVGKSSVINLIAGDKVADTSPGLQGCTLEATDYWFSLSKEVALHIFDTVGLEEPEISVTSFLSAIEKAHQLIMSLRNAGGVDLLLFCIRGGRLTATVQRNYRLFFEVLCESQVPLAVVVTNLELEDVMEDWWVRNAKIFQRYDIHPVAHACITAVSDHVTIYAQKRAESREALRKMLLDTLSNSGPSESHIRDARKWFTAVLRTLRSFSTKKSPKKQDLLRTLQTRCMLTNSDAQQVMKILAGDRREVADAAT